MNKFGGRIKLGQSQSSFHKSSNGEPQQYPQQDQQSNPDPEELMRRQESFEESMSLNIKEHIDKLDEALMRLRDELKNSRKEMNLIRDELAKVKQDSMKGDDGVTSYVCDEVFRYIMKNKELRKGSTNNLNLANNYTVQLVNLQLDREDIDINRTVTEQRTDMCEHNVGFKRVYE